jgi:hypothetical protein
MTTGTRGSPTLTYRTRGRWFVEICKHLK